MERMEDFLIPITTLLDSYTFFHVAAFQSIGMLSERITGRGNKESWTIFHEWTECVGR